MLVELEQRQKGVLTVDIMVLSITVLRAHEVKRRVVSDLADITRLLTHLSQHGFALRRAHVHRHV